jgi:hypothetical protein
MSAEKPAKNVMTATVRITGYINALVLPVTVTVSTVPNLRTSVATVASVAQLPAIETTANTSVRMFVVFVMTANIPKSRQNLRWSKIHVLFVNHATATAVLGNGAVRKNAIADGVRKMVIHLKQI